MWKLLHYPPLKSPVQMRITGALSATCTASVQN